MDHITPMVLAGLLYIGAGIGMGLMMLFKKIIGKHSEQKYLNKKDLPYTFAMVVLYIIAPILLMYGIASTNSANVSLLGNFEIVATSLIAMLVFKEKISSRLWMAIILVTAGGVILGFEGTE